MKEDFLLITEVIKEDAGQSHAVLAPVLSVPRVHFTAEESLRSARDYFEARASGHVPCAAMRT